MIYLCNFDFTVCNPKTSQFKGKSGTIELTTTNPLFEEEIARLKMDEEFLHNIGADLNKSLKQKNIFSIIVRGITPKK